MPKGVYKRTEYTKKKISEYVKAHPISYWKGKNLSTETKNKISNSLTGIKQSEETRKKRSLSMMGKNTQPKSEIAKQRMSVSKIGVHIGNKNGMWKGGVTPVNQKIRTSKKYKLWRDFVFKRDDYTCRNCLVRGLELNAHHIKSFALFPELRFEVNNGITLCVKCHRKTKNYGNRK